MTSIGSPSPFFLAGKKAYAVDRSLRFNYSDSPQLKRTGSSTSSSYTVSLWFKYTGVGKNEFNLLFSLGQSNDANSAFMGINNNDQFIIYNNGGYQYTSTRVYRDPSAWYHFTMSVNSNSYTAYINNESIDTGTLRSLDTSSDGLRIGIQYGNYYPFNGYIADFYLIDGSALTPSSFTETNAETGQLVPKLYTGSFGTSGAHITFSDNSGTTATTLGKDSSGNGNNFTPNNFGTGDAVKDSPTNNFCNFLVLQKTAETTFSEGNLKATSSNSHKTFYGNFGLRSGKWYWEGLAVAGSTTKWTYGVSDIENTKNTQISGQNYLLAVSSGSPSDATYAFGDAVSIYNTNLYKNGSVVSSSYQTTPSAGDIIGIALDVDTGKVWFARNGTWINGSATASTTLNESSHDTTVATGKVYNAAFSAENCSWQTNFGQDSSFSNAKTAQGNTDGNTQGDFYYAVPSGFKAICSANLPDPTILLPNKHFAAFTYTGTGSYGTDYTFTDSDVDFTPDWIWIKGRPVVQEHTLTDSVRGVAKQLNSASTDAETTNAYRVNSFIQSGFTSGTDGVTNWPSRTFIAWNWNAGDTDGKTYTVTVVSDSGNKYRFDGFGTSAVTLDLAEGGTYIFNYPSAHPLKFSTTSDGTHGGGSEYTTGVTHNSSTQVTIVVAASAPQLFYYCSIHSGMGGAINTNSTLGSSNFDGTIQSVAKVNALAGFSILKYTGTGSAGTIGHGLGVAPKVVIVKARSGTHSWRVYFSGVTDTDGKYLSLDSTIGVTSGSDKWNGTPTSSVFGVSGDNSTGGSSVTYVSYVFSEVSSYSKFGSYTGNGNSNGTFVFTGFRPAFILTKRSDGTSPWRLFDNKRPDANFQTYKLEADSFGAELTGYAYADFLSNGFKIRDSGSYQNASGGTYIYLAFAESPFKNARAR